MGNGLSCCRSTSTFNGVRVVHINGYVEDFPGPVTVAEVAGKPPTLVCFSPAQLLSFAAARPLGLDQRLEPGRLYFLLPHSVLQTSDSSSVDLAVLAARLTALARRGGGGGGGGGAVAATHSASKIPAFPYVGECNDSAAGGHADAGTGRRYMNYVVGADGLGRGTTSSTKLRAWKPLLDTIEESFRWSAAADERSSVRRSTPTRGMSSRSDGTYSRLVEEAGGGEAE